MSHSVLTQLQNAPAGTFHVLEPAKAARMKAATLYIPSPLEVATEIARIPKGQTRTMLQLRVELARLGNADTACPYQVTKCWRCLAHAYDEALLTDPRFAVPWWRILKEGKVPQLPGGIEQQRLLLEGEGVALG